MADLPMSRVPSSDSFENLTPLARHWRSVILVPLLAGVAGYGCSYLVRPVFSSATVFLPPQQQGGTSAAIASLGALASLANGGANTKGSSDQYVGLMQSTTIADKMIATFKLMDIYGESFHDKARKELALNTKVSVGKKDGLITVAVEDTDPVRAAAMANQYVDELRHLTAGLAITEAQQRRVFFEKQMLDVKAKMVAAQTALQDSGFTLGALKSEPRAAAEGYGRLQAEVTASEIRLRTLRAAFGETTPEVQQELTHLQALHEQLRALEQSNAPPPDATGPDYVGKYREFKYQETLFELMARQYELARVDESRDGAVFQVVDPAKPPEHKARPQRIVFAIGGAVGALVLYSLWIIGRSRFRATFQDPVRGERWRLLIAAMRRA